MMAKVKASTGIVGLEVVPNAREVLIGLYSKTLKEIQNHGIRNCPPTKEVQEFVGRWLEHVRQLKRAGAKTKKETAA